MHIFAQKPQVPQQSVSTKPTIHGQKNTATANSETTPDTARLDWDFGRMPVHAPAAARVQTKLKLGMPGDLYEQEADRIAAEVMRTPEPPTGAAGGYPARADRQNSPTQLQTKRVQANDSAGAEVPPMVHDVLRSPGRPLDVATRAFMEPGFRSDFGQVRVHADAQSAQASDALDARAFTVGHHIAFGAGQYAPATQQGKSLIAHELVHTMQQAPAAGSAAGGGSGQTVQRAVRVQGGAGRIKEFEYQKGGAKEKVGSKSLVSDMIADGVHRVFLTIDELDAYANGTLDYLGDVATKSAGTFWYRLPKDKLTVLGEEHDNPNGNVEDVITGFHTARFKYEAMHELTGLSALKVPFTGTEARLAQVNAGYKSASQANLKKFDPNLENIVIKVLANASMIRNEFIAKNPDTMDPAKKKDWSSRASTGDYSAGERAALYLSYGIHLASDLAAHTFAPPDKSETPFVAASRKLKEAYLKNQTELDKFMKKKDGDDLIGIYELTEPGKFSVLPAINDFCLAFHEYGSRYVEQLGSEHGNKALKAEGKSLLGNTGATLEDVSPAREEIMWEKITDANAKGFLIVGMGDKHRTNLQPRLDKAKIPHEKVDEALVRQQKEVDKKWK